VSKQRPSIAQVAQRKHRHRLGIVSMCDALLQWSRLNHADMPDNVHRKIIAAQKALNDAYELEARNNEFITGRKCK